MSWDVMIFNLKRKVDSVDEIDESVLVDIGTKADFKKIMTDNYRDIIWDKDWGKIERKDFSFEFSLGDSDEPFSNTTFHLYGENAIYEIVELCKKNNWQLFDTGLEQMVDLDNPENNGYKNHQTYVRQILNGQ
jgi:hypothetical protein